MWLFFHFLGGFLEKVAMRIKGKRSRGPHLHFGRGTGVGKAMSWYGDSPMVIKASFRVLP